MTKMQRKIKQFYIAPVSITTLLKERTICSNLLSLVHCTDICEFGPSLEARVGNIVDGGGETGDL